MSLRLILLAVALPFIITGVLCAEIVAARKKELDVARLVSCICDIEGGKWGDLGGKANMQRATWHDRTHLDYELSRNPDHAIPVYESHVLWLKHGLEADGLRVTPARLYECWLIGLTAGIARIRYGSLSNAAQRCQNLYDDHR